VPITVPPLRDRLEDVPALANYFLERSGRELGRSFRGLTADCLAALLQHDWPGNLRELQTLIEHAAITSPGGGWIDADALALARVGRTPADAHAAANTSRATPIPAGGPDDDNGLLPLAELAKRHILAALERTHNNRTHAARLLGISIRTLRNKLHEYGVKPRGDWTAPED
jgi:transcriptional regulator with PAS, ATPase and Fis domain